MRIETFAAGATIIGTLIAVFLQYFAPMLNIERGTAITISLLIAGFAILIPMNIIMMYRWRNVDKILKLLKTAIDSLIQMLQTVHKEISSKNSQQQITWGEMQQLLATIAIPYFTQIGQKAFDIYFESIQSTPEERRKKELMEKARKQTITYTEAEELKKLLEKQKKEKEQAGDIVGAILLGLALLFVIWLLSELTKPRK